MTIRFGRVGGVCAAITFVLASLAQVASAATWWWDTTTTGLWTDGANWSNNATSGGTTGTVPTNDTTTDIAFFNQSSVNGNQTVQLGADRSIGGIIIANTGSTSFASDSATARLLTLGASGITVNSGAGNVTFGSAANPVNLAIATSSTFAMNVGSRTLTINGGISRSAGDTTSRMLTIAGNVTTGSISIAGPISNGGASGNLGLTMSGSGTLLLTGTNTYTGTTFFDAGTVQVAANATTFSNAFSGNGDFTFRGGTLFLTSAGSANLGTRIKNSTSEVRLTTNSVSAGITATIDNSNVGGFTKGGLGGVTLTGNSTYSGPTTVSAGGLTVTGSLNPATTVTLGSAGNGATFQLGSASGAVNQEIAGLTRPGTGAVVVQGGHATNISTLTVNIASGSTSSYSGALGGSGVAGNLALTKAGPGTFALSGTNTYVGLTKINAGTLIFSSAASLYGGTTASWTATNLTTASGATAAFGVAGTGGFTSANLDTVLGMASTGTTGFVAGSSFGIDTTGTTFTYATNIGNANGGANSLGFAKLGSGTLTLSGNNNYTGTTTLAAGVLNVGSAETAGTAGPLGNSAASNPGSIVLSGGTLQYSAANQNDYSGRFSTASSQQYNVDTNGQNVTWGTALTSSSGSLTKLGSGTLRLAGANTYTGSTTISAGVLALSGNAALAATGAVNAASGATLDISGIAASSLTVGAISGSAGSAVVLGSTTLVIGDATSTTFAGTVSGFGNLTKQGGGTVILDAANSYTGTTTINAGTLQVGAGSTTAALGGLGAITGSAGATLAFSRTNAVTQGTDFGSVIGGSINVTQLASGTLVLNGVNTYTGTTTLGGGILQVGSSAALGTGGVVTFTGGTMQYLAAGAGLDPSARIKNSSSAIAVTPNGQSVTFAGAIDSTNTGGLTASGATGSLTLSASNSYLGGTTLAGGNVIIGNNAAFGQGIVTNSSSSTIQANTDLTGVGNTFVLGGDLYFTGANGISLTGTVAANANNRSFFNNIDPGKTLTLNAVQLSTNATGNNFMLRGTGNTVVNGVISDGTAVGVTPGSLDLRTDTMTLANANTYSGGTLLNQPNANSVLLIGSNSSFGTGPVTINAATVTLQASTDLTNVANAFTQIQSIAIAGSNSISLTGTWTMTSGARTLTNNLAAGKSLTLNRVFLTGTDTTARLFTLGGTGNTTITGVISDGTAAAGSSFTIQNTGTTTLSAANTYTGTTTLIGVSGVGVNVIMGNNAAFGTGGVVLNRAGNTISANTDLNDVKNAFTFLNNTTFSGTSSISLTGTLTQQAAANTLTNNIAAGKSLTLSRVFLTGTDTTARTLTLAGTGNTTFSGVISDGTAAAGSGLTVTNTGTATLSAANTYTGTSTLSGGLVNLGSAETAGTSGPLGRSAAANPGSIVLTGGTLQYSAANQNDYSGRFSTAASQRYNVDTNGRNVTWATALTSSGGSLTKLGSGTLTLTAANTYSGATTISAGVLALAGNGALATTGAVNAASGATFDISGITASSLTVGAITGAAGSAVTLGSKTLAIGDATSTTFASTVSGAGNLTKQGAGTVTLTAASTYTGTTTLTAGVLSLGSAETAGTSGPLGNSAASNSGSIVLSGGTLQYSAANQNDYSGRFSTAASQRYNVDTNGQSVTWATALASSGGSLTKSGSGTLFLTGANTYTGTTTLTAGVVNLGSAENAGVSGPLGVGGTILFGTTVGAGGTLQYSAANQFDYSSRFSTVAGQQFIVDTNGQSVTWATGAPSSSTSTFTKLGSGTLTLSGNNGWAGLTTISAGVLATSGADRINNASVVSVASGATFRIGGADTTAVLVGSGTVDLGANKLTLGLTSSGTFSGSIIGTGILGVSGNGHFYITGSNSYSGGTDLRAARTFIGNDASLGTGAITLGAFGATTLASADANTRTLSNNLAWGAGNPWTFGTPTTGNLIFTGTWTSNPTAGNTITIDNALTQFTNGLGGGTAGRTKLGAGTLAVGGTSTYTGTTAISQGVLSAASIGTSGTAGALGTTGVIALGSGTNVGTLRYTGSGETSSRSFTLSGSAGFGGVIEANGSGGLALTGAVTAAPGAKTLTLGGTSTADNSFGTLADASDSAASSLLKTGLGRWVLSGSSSYKGPTTVDQGELILGASAQGQGTNGSLGNNSSAAITIGSAAGSGTASLLLQAGVQVDSRTITVPSGSQLTVLGGVNTSGTATFGSSNLASISLGRDVRFQAGDGGTVVFQNAWSFSGTSARTITVGSAGNAGTVQLGSALGTTGTVNLTAGTLRLSPGGSIASAARVVVGPAGSVGTVLDVASLSGSYVVASGQTLGGGGTLRLDADTPVSIAGIFSPGNSPGLFTFDGPGTTTLAGTTLMEIEGLSRGVTGGYDAVNLTNGSSLVLGGLLQLSFSGTFADDTTFNLFTETGSGLSGNFSGVSVLGPFYNGLTWTQTSGTWTSTSTEAGQSLRFSSTDGTLVVVPEPATLALAAIGLGLGGWVALRRRT